MIVKERILDSIVRVVNALQGLDRVFVFVGGAVVGLYSDDPGAGDIRPTKDVDITLQITSNSDLENLRQELFVRGFKFTADQQVMCRFKFQDILVDVLSTKPIGWAPANPWFEPGFQQLKIVSWKNIEFYVMKYPYFLASKFVAFRDRGGNPVTSHDFEDIVYLMDNRVQFVKDIVSSDENVRQYLVSEFELLLSNPYLNEALQAHLEYGTGLTRMKRIVDNMQAVIDSGCIQDRDF